MGWRPASYTLIERELFKDSNEPFTSLTIAGCDRKKYEKLHVSENDYFANEMEHDKLSYNVI